MSDAGAILLPGIVNSQNHDDHEEPYHDHHDDADGQVTTTYLPEASSRDFSRRAQPRTNSP